MPSTARHTMKRSHISALLQAAKADGKTRTRSDGGGLTLTITSAGYGAWILRYYINDKRKEITIGSLTSYTLKDARDEAQALRARIDRGENVAQAKQDEKFKARHPYLHKRGPQTLRQLVSEWHETTIQCKYKHPERVMQTFDKWVFPTLGERCLTDIEPLQIVELLKDVKSEAPTVANDLYRLLGRAFDWASVLRFIRDNPMAAMRPDTYGAAKEPGRDRMLSLGEINALLKAMHAHRIRFGRPNELAVRLLLVTGMRKNELLQLEWQNVDFRKNDDSEKCIITSSNNKSNNLLRIALPERAVNWLRELQAFAAGSDYVFPARRLGKRGKPHVSADTLNRALAMLIKSASLEPFTVHDLRRTMRSQLSAIGVRPEVGEKCLNHKLGGVLAIYDRHDYYHERRDALASWASVLDVLESEGVIQAGALVGRYSKTAHGRESSHAA